MKRGRETKANSWATQHITLMPSNFTFKSNACKKKKKSTHKLTYFERPAEFGRCLLFTPCSKQLPFKLEATLYPAASLLWEFSWLVRAATSKRSYKSGKPRSKYRNCSCPQNMHLLDYHSIMSPTPQKKQVFIVNVHMWLSKKCWHLENTFQHCP